MQYRITIVIEAHNPTHGYETVFDSADKVLSHEEVCRVLRGTADSIEAGNITMAEARGFTQGLVNFQGRENRTHGSAKPCVPKHQDGILYPARQQNYADTR